MENTSDYQEVRDKILNDPCTHYTLANAIRAFDKMDPVDALYDAEVLLELMQSKNHPHAVRRSLRHTC